MQTSLWIIFLVITGFLGFLIGYSQPQYQPPSTLTVGSAQTTIQKTVTNRDLIETGVDDAFWTRRND